MMTRSLLSTPQCLASEGDTAGGGLLRPVDHLLFRPEWRCDRCDAVVSASEADGAEQAANELWNSKESEDIHALWFMWDRL